MIEYWHNPRCSKSREGLALLESKGAEVTVRRYLEVAPTLAELTAAWNALGKPPVIEMMRPKEAAFREAGLTKDVSDATLLQAMADHPVQPVYSRLTAHGNRKDASRSNSRKLIATR